MALEISSVNNGRFFPALILVGDLFLLNLVLFSFRTVISPPGFTTNQLYIICSLAYLFASGPNSVILHYRKVHNYQIVGNVFKNLFFFNFILILILYSGDRLSSLSPYYFIYQILSYLAIVSYRLILRKIVKVYRNKGRNQRFVVLVGTGYNSIQLYDELTSDSSSGFSVEGYFADQPCSDYPERCHYLGTPSETITWLDAHPYVSQLYCSLSSARKNEILPIINYCENHLVHFYSLPNLYNFMHNRVYINILDTVPFLSLRKDPLSLCENRLFKRLIDFLVSGVFLCTLFPLIFLVVAVVTKLTMPGPVFFKQKRNGLNDKEFYCYKFRSMKVNDEADSLQATKNDSRTTKWGSFMRKTSIDELPQFINVFKGEMSVVGPRPHMLKHTIEYSRLIDKYMVRHFVKPGVTGWAQVTGFRGETKELKDMEGRIKADIWYIEHWSFWLDMYIIYKTIVNAIHGEANAY